MIAALSVWVRVDSARAVASNADLSTSQAHPVWTDTATLVCPLSQRAMLRSGAVLSAILRQAEALAPSVRSAPPGPGAAHARQDDRAGPFLFLRGDIVLRTRRPAHHRRE